MSQCRLQSKEDLPERPAVHIGANLQKEEVIAEAHLATQNHQRVSGQTLAAAEKRSHRSKMKHKISLPTEKSPLCMQDQPPEPQTDESPNPEAAPEHG